MPITIRSLDHLVLTVASIEKTAAFYSRVLGMEVRTFGQGRVALHFGRQKINLHEVGRVVDPNVRHATPGSADFCLLTDAPMEEVLAHLRGCGVSVVEGPVNRTGAVHGLRSVYFYDPDENLVEIAHEVQPPAIHRGHEKSTETGGGGRAVAEVRGSRILGPHSKSGQRQA